jgi:hypothetical protein
MESIASPLHFVTYLLRTLETSQSLDNSLRSYLQTESNDICPQIKVFYERWLAKDLGNFDFVPKSQHYRKAIFEVIWMGLNGKTIYPVLKTLEEEIIQACEQEIHSQASKLPFLLLLPLLLLQTPAFLLLLFGPILKQLVEAF